MFLIRISLTFVMLIPRMRRMFRWRNTSRVSRRDWRKAQLSHPHKRRLQGIALKIMYFEYMSTWGSSQNFPSAPIAALAAPTLFATSWSSRSEYDSKKKMLVECGVFRMGGAGSATVTVHLGFMSKLISPSSSVTSKMLLDSILPVVYLW